MPFFLDLSPGSLALDMFNHPAFVISVMEDESVFVLVSHEFYWLRARDMRMIVSADDLKHDSDTPII